MTYEWTKGKLWLNGSVRLVSSGSGTWDFQVLRAPRTIIHRLSPQLLSTLSLTSPLTSPHTQVLSR